MFSRVSIVRFCAISMLAMNAAGQLQTITFDDIPAGMIRDQYADRGVRFFRGNGEFGQSTGPREIEGQVQSAYVGNFGTSVSGPNVLVPAPHCNDDIWVFFYNSKGDRTTVSSFGLTNDREAQPARIFLDGFNADGTLLAKAEVFGSGAVGSVMYEGIYAARISSAPGEPGYLGVDDFVLCLEPEILNQPGELQTCDHGVLTFETRVFRGEWSSLWQARSINSEIGWTDLSADGKMDVEGFDVGEIVGTGTPLVAIYGTGAQAGTFEGLIRCVVTTECGEVASEPTYFRACVGDYNCDGGVDGTDVDIFFVDWEGGDFGSDVNRDGGIDGTDVFFFFDRWENGC